jgi:hypothetical protein
MKVDDYKIYASFGYLPNPRKVDFKLAEEKFNNHLDLTNSIFDRYNYSGKHLVPLSGGLDSRYILTKILQRVNAEDVQCVTFGDSYSYDVRFARIICKNLGIKWKFIETNLLKRIEKYNVNTSVENERHIFYSFPYFEVGNFDHIWNGVLGDYLYDKSLNKKADHTNSNFKALYKNKSVFNLDDDILDYLDTYSESFSELNSNIKDAFMYGDRLPNYYIPNTRISYQENRPFTDMEYLGGLRFNQRYWNVSGDEARLKEIENQIGVFPYKNRVMNSPLVNTLMRINDGMLRFYSKSAYANYYQEGQIYRLYRLFKERNWDAQVLEYLSVEQRNFYHKVKRSDFRIPLNQVRLLNIMSVMLMHNE